MVFRHSIANTSTTSFARQIRNGAPAFWREDNDAPFSCFLLCKPEQHTKSYDYEYETTTSMTMDAAE
jgi:hypothetical protein